MNIKISVICFITFLISWGGFATHVFFWKQYSETAFWIGIAIVLLIGLPIIALHVLLYTGLLG